MIILLKNKETLIYDNFQFKCCVGKKGIIRNKIEGDRKTPKGIKENQMNLKFHLTHTALSTQVIFHCMQIKICHGRYIRPKVCILI